MFFLTLLPALGWVWHRVLPEHTHVFVGTTHLGEDEVSPALSTPDEEQTSCFNCSGTQISSGVEHLPSSFGLQVLGMAAIAAMLFIFLPPHFSNRVTLSSIFYQSPVLLPSDPPPNKSI